MELNTHAALQKMREVIVERGWMAGGTFGPHEEGPVCILGAAAVALNCVTWDYVPEKHPVVRALGFENASEAYCWNDELLAHVETREDREWGAKLVLARVDKAIEATRIKEPDEELTPYKVTPLEEPTPNKAPAPAEPEPLVPDKEPLVPA